jgi:hypothetical protein
MTLLALAGCERKYFEWTEDVRLADGSTVQVERTTRYGRISNEMGGPTSRWVSEATVTIVDRGRRLPTWSHPMEAFVLDKDTATGRWQLVASAVKYCDYASRFDPSRVTFPTFEFDGAQWVYVSLPESMLNHRANLLVGTPKADRGRDPHLTAEDIAASNARLMEWGVIDPKIAGYCARQHDLKK